MCAQAAKLFANPVADRFVGFAFTSADLLVETDLDGRITFATGAFRLRLGEDAASFLGRPASSLFVPADILALDMAMAEVRLRGRINPLVLRLAGAGASPMAVSSMLMPGCSADERNAAREDCLYFSIGPVPRAPNPLQSQIFQDRIAFINLAEETLRSGRSGNLGLITVPPSLSALSADRDALHENIRVALVEAVPGAAAGDLGNGRFGLLSQNDIDIQDLLSRLKMLLPGAGATAENLIDATATPLNAANLPPAQAVRALRYALGRFAEGQTSAGAATVGQLGLAGIIAKADAQARKLRSTIMDRKFRLVFQPVVTLSTRQVHHYEALVRPIQAEGEPVQSVQDFVTFAEIVGLSEDLDWAVLQTALDALRDSAAASIAVNMSGLSMQSPAYRQRLLAQVAEAHALINVNGQQRLLIELTETAEINDLKGAGLAITELRRSGVRVCLDDFGAGSCSFRYLRAFPVDYVKIDGGYTSSAGTHPRDRAVLASMVEVSTSAGAEVVAEKIESEEEARLMMEIGIKFGQGWLFGRPGRLPKGR